ncbi:hypothetical protein V2O64_15695 [Verrucomicrobiaceae bacterium 227]
MKQEPLAEGNDARFEELSEAYSTMLQFEGIMAAISKKFPELAEEVKAAEAEMAASAVGKGFRGVEVELKRRMGREFIAYEKGIRAQIQEFQEDAAKEVDLETAKMGLGTAAAMAKGRVQVDVLRNVIAYNPEYRKDPAKEFSDGWAAGYSSKMDEQKREVNYLLMYPGSWKPTNLASKAELMALWNDAGHGRHRLSFQSINAPDPKYAKMDPVELAKALMAPEGTLIESGKGKMAGLECGRVVYDLTVEKDQKIVMSRVITYAVLAKEHFVILSLMLGSEGELGKEELVKKYGPLLAGMAAKLEIE